jgi:hypothetical protein
MKNLIMDVFWYDNTDLANLNLHLGMDTSDTETMATVVCGEVSGELDPPRLTRSGWRARAGPFQATHPASC